jgi:acyl-CoA reductase-like NAD-dependent aldehyde dehydrogenase
MKSSVTTNRIATGARAQAAALAERLGTVMRLRADELCDAAAAESGRQRDDLMAELEGTAAYLERELERAAAGLSGRRAICTEDQWACLMLPSNISVGSVGLITTLLVAGNRVHARMPGRATRSAGAVQSVFDEVMPGAVMMERSATGPEFVEHIAHSSDVPFAYVFGGEALGDELLERCRAGLAKRIVFEGPGKDPFIVLAGANVDEAANRVIEAKFFLSGQTCVAPENLIVDRTLHDALVERLVSACEGARVGDPDQPGTTIGPMISERVPPIVRAQLADARQRGAEIVCGGTVDGRIVEPTVVTGVTTEMSLFQDETFAPVFAVVGFDDPADAIELACAGRFGLSCNVHGPDAERVASALAGAPYAEPVDDLVFGRYGTVRTNGRFGGPEPLRAFGGYGKSGWIWDADGLRQGPKSPTIEATV